MWIDSWVYSFLFYPAVEMDWLEKNSAANSHVSNFPTTNLLKQHPLCYESRLMMLVEILNGLFGVHLGRLCSWGLRFCWLAEILDGKFNYLGHGSA